MRVERGERIIFRGHPSWASRPGYCLRGVLIALLAGVIAGLASAVGHGGHVQVPWVVVAVLIAFAWRLGFGQLRLARTTYAVTSRRVVVERGLLIRRRRQARLERVVGVYVSQSWFERLLGVGTVYLETVDDPDGEVWLSGVASPRWIASVVEDQLRPPAYAPAPLAAPALY